MVHITKSHLEGSSFKVAVHTSQESFRRRQYESCSVYIFSHLEASCLKVAVHISRESIRGKQFESCGAYISRVIYKEAV